MVYIVSVISSKASFLLVHRTIRGYMPDRNDDNGLETRVGEGFLSTSKH